MFSYMSVCLSVLGHVHVTEVDHRHQKRTSEPLELALHVIMNYLK